jgi:hypothetical protein
VPLQFRHVYLELGQLVRETRLLLGRGVWEKLLEKTLNLLLTRVVQLNMHVCTTWSQEGRV